MYQPAEAGDHYARDPEDGSTMFGDDGSPLEELVQEWDIFDDSIVDEIPGLLEELWPGYEADTLYASEDLWYEPPDKAFETLAKRLKHERRWFAKVTGTADDVEIEHLLGEHLDHFAGSPKAGEKWYRARKHDRWIGSRRPTVYSPTEIGCPPKERITAGMRANPAGIPYLYLGSDERTAIAEVRALVRDYVSVGEFTLAKDLKLIDLAKAAKGFDPFEYPDINAELERRSLLRAFGRWLSKPVRDEDHEVDYVVTQYLAEYIAHRGYDGILFKSAMAHNGKNLVLFDPAGARCDKVSLKFIKLAKMRYVTKDVV